MKKILLFHMGGLGDLLVTFPSIHLIRKCYPSSAISLVCQKEYGKVLEGTGVVDECLSKDSRHMVAFFSGSSTFGEELGQRLKDFDGAVGWFQKESSLSDLEFVLSSTGISFRLFVYDKHSEESISQYFFRKTTEFLKQKGRIYLCFEECARLPLSSVQKKEGRKLLGEKRLKSGAMIVIIHPGSGSQVKCWPFRNFLEIIERLKRRKFQGVLVSGPAEERMEQEIKTTSLPENWIWLRYPSLLRLAGLLSESSFYLGNDSGITHLAAACGTIGLALFREDLEQAWSPYGRISVLSEASVKNISSDIVWEMIGDRLSFR